MYKHLKTYDDKIDKIILNVYVEIIDSIKGSTYIAREVI